MELLLSDPALMEAYFFETSDLETLTLLKGLDECGSFREGIMGTRIQPSKAPAERLHL